MPFIMINDQNIMQKLQPYYKIVTQRSIEQ